MKRELDDGSVVWCHHPRCTYADLVEPIDGRKEDAKECLLNFKKSFPNRPRAVDVVSGVVSNPVSEGDVALNVIQLSLRKRKGFVEGFPQRPIEIILEQPIELFVDLVRA